jgi:hypothetical protein
LAARNRVSLLCGVKRLEFELAVAPQFFSGIVAYCWQFGGPHCLYNQFNAAGCAIPALPTACWGNAESLLNFPQCCDNSYISHPSPYGHWRKARLPQLLSHKFIFDPARCL